MEESKVKSLVKAMHVLECFSVEKPELGVTEIAQMLELPKSTVHNILSTYGDMGYVSCNPITGKYHLGLRLLHFSYIINTHLGIRNIFLPYLHRIADAVGETTYLGMPYEQDVLYIESVVPQGNGASRNILGERAPLYCTGLGKSMLAFLPDCEDRFPAEFRAFTDTTITNPADMHRDLEEIRQRGYAIDNMEHEYGIKCVAVPVRGHSGTVVAAVSVSAPSLRMDDAAIIRNAGIIHEILQPLQGKL